MTKLSWSYDQSLDCEVAYVRGYRIRAERDDDAPNPFEDMDGNWPIAVYHGRDIKVYEKTKGRCVDEPLARFSDALLVHDQKALGKILGVYRSDFDNYMHLTEDPDGEVPKWITNVDVPREAFVDAFNNEYASGKLELCEQLYKLCGIPCYRTTSTGYSQGDWAEVLVVATPEAQEAFGCKEVTEKDLESTADLYGYWAWGDVYGYIIEKPVLDEDGDIEWVEACDHNSCWGYYGDDHHESGLEEQALECVPEEPVVSHDKLLEDEDPPCPANRRPQSTCPEGCDHGT